MRAASSIGLLSYKGAQRFGLTPRGHLLRSDVPGSLRALALMQTANAHWQCWAHFPEAVRQGRSQAEQALGADVFTYFAQQEILAQRPGGQRHRPVAGGALWTNRMRPLFDPS